MRSQAKGFEAYEAFKEKYCPSSGTHASPGAIDLTDGQRIIIEGRSEGRDAELNASRSVAEKWCRCPDVGYPHRVKLHIDRFCDEVKRRARERSRSRDGESGSSA